jgi:hypothetical protein
MEEKHFGISMGVKTDVQGFISQSKHHPVDPGRRHLSDAA